MRGHEEASGTKYVPKDVMDYWAAKDPVINFEKQLLEDKVYSSDEISQVKEDIKKEINAAVKESFDGKEFIVNHDEEVKDVFFPYEQKIIFPKDKACLLYTSPSPRDQRGSRMPSSA